jgi:CheY-like chemotaxis protein
MLTSQDGHSDKGRVFPPELDIQEVPQHAVALESAQRSAARIPTAAGASAQCRHRILVVDDDPSVREMAREILESEHYEVFTANDGLGGLIALSKSLPDLIITDLNMPRMSGFEFLAIVRQRFPQIATIATSGDHITNAKQSAVFADAFLQKGQYTIAELFQQIARLLAAAPIRSETKRSAVAALFVPRNDAGDLIITCPTCLRPNRRDARRLNSGIHETTCQSCGTPVKFEIDQQMEPLIKRRCA